MTSTALERETRPLLPLAIAVTVASLGGVLFGYDNIVISGAIDYLARYFHLDPVGIGWAAGCALIGCIIGSAGAGAVADRLGLRRGLILCALCFVVSSVGIMWFASSFTRFVLWRMLAGIGYGGASVISPNYIAEAAPARVRGRLVTLYQMGIVVGILAAVVANMWIQRMGDDSWNTAVGWRWMFFAGIVPAVLFGVMILPSVESPRWLMKVGRTEEGLEVLKKLDTAAEAAREAREIEESLSLEEGHFSELFTTFRRPLLLGIMLAGLTQVSGITPLFSFLPTIFKTAGNATSSAFGQAVLVSLINLAFTIVALWLVDKAGRKTLILAGSTIQFFSFLLVGWFFHSHGSGLAVLVFVMSFVAGHAVGNGVACWVIISEIYPNKVRGRGMSIAIMMLWIVCYIGNQLFPVMMRDLGPSGTFWTFAGGALLTFILVFLLIPETKGRSLEQITLFWTRRGDAR